MEIYCKWYYERHVGPFHVSSYVWFAYNGLPDGEIFYQPYGSVVCLKYENRKYTGWKVSYWKQCQFYEMS